MRTPLENNNNNIIIAGVGGCGRVGGSVVQPENEEWKEAMS